MILQHFHTVKPSTTLYIEVQVCNIPKNSVGTDCTQGQFAEAGLFPGKSKEAVLNQKLLCLYRSSAYLPGFASYFKVSALSGN